MGIINGKFLHLFGKTGEVHGKLPGWGAETDLSLLVRPEENQGFLMPFVAMSAGGFDEVGGTVGAEAPEDFISVAVLGHGDVQPVNAFPSYFHRQAYPLRDSGPAADGLTIVGKRHFLKDLAVRTEKDSCRAIEFFSWLARLKKKDVPWVFLSLAGNQHSIRDCPNS